jgi:phage terminase large subunit-like protein
MNDFPDFDQKEIISYIGVDLSSTSDLTAVNYLIIKDNIYYMDTRYYLPKEYKTRTSYNQVKFDEWAGEGYLTLTPGNVTDYDYILNDILAHPY